MTHRLIAREPRWFRSRQKVCAGVCSGLAERLGADPWLIRVAWLASICLLGFGILAYVALAVSLPREDDQERAQDSKVLGVCVRLSRILDVDVGLLRAAMIVIGFGSLGTTVLAYLLLHFVVPDTQAAYQQIPMRRV